MEKELFDELIQSLNQAVAFEKGDKAQGRAVARAITGEEIEQAQLFYQNFSKLTEVGKEKAIQYVDELLQAQ
jgi:hypothetical protein